MKLIHTILMSTFISGQVLGSEFDIQENSKQVDSQTDQLSKTCVGGWKNLVSGLLENNNLELPSHFTDLSRAQHFYFLDRQLNFSLPMTLPTKEKKALAALVALDIISNSKIKDSIHTLSEEEFQDLLHDVVIEKYQSFQEDQFLQTLARLSSKFLEKHEDTISLTVPPMIATLVIFILIYFQSL